jgi:hypothetical protein
LRKHGRAKVITRITTYCGWEETDELGDDDESGSDDELEDTAEPTSVNEVGRCCFVDVC